MTNRVFSPVACQAPFFGIRFAHPSDIFISVLRDPITLRLTSIEVKIIWRLHRRGKYGAAHTPVQNAVKGLRKDLRGDAVDAVDHLIREGVLVAKPTGYGLEVALNRDMIAMIHRVCDWYLRNINRIRDYESYDIP